MLRQFLALLCSVPAALLHFIRPGVRILMYHRVSESAEFDQLTVDPARFEQQMALLKSTANVLSLNDAVERLKNGAKLKENSVVITFDDGYLDNLQQALPVLERYQLPATIFVTTDFAAQQSAHSRYKPGNNALHLNWAQLRELAQHPLITLGSHTISHPYLQAIEQEQARAEIVDSAVVLEKELGDSMDTFCYPSGDYGQRELDILESGPYRAAVTVAPGVNRGGQALFELNRTEVTDKDTALMFRCKLLGAFDVLHNVLHLRRKWQFSQQAKRKLTEVEL